MKEIMVYDTFTNCPDCGNHKNYTYDDREFVSRTKEQVFYIDTKNYICRNKTCNNRWSENDKTEHFKYDLEKKISEQQ